MSSVAGPRILESLFAPLEERGYRGE